MALYAEHAVFESPTVLAQFPDRDDGILRWAAPRSRNCSPATSRTCARSSESSTDRPVLLQWSAPHLGISAADAQRRAGRLFESMDIENGLIVYHRVYWGWQGLKSLLAVRDRRT